MKQAILWFVLLVAVAAAGVGAYVVLRGKKNNPITTAQYTGRKGQGDHVATVELFTGAHCPPCVAADMAFDSLMDRYPSKDVILLQYHLHAPLPDPMTNTVSEGRAGYYGVEGTPTLFVDGRSLPVFGGRRDSQRRYDEICDVVDEQLEEKAQVKLRFNATRRDDKITLEADVTGPERTGNFIRLRFLIVEEAVRYAGSNGQSLHHHVVRATPGGLDGFALTEKSTSQSVSVTVGEVRQEVKEYLDRFPRKDEFGETPLELKHLLAIVLVQDDRSKAVLQAAQVDLDSAAKSSP